MGCEAKRWVKYPGMRSNVEGVPRGEAKIFHGWRKMYGKNNNKKNKKIIIKNIYSI